ncbi:class I SAM-dependent methyltransferase [Goodfellowiella coeruleoviolacea]|uniref:Ubiquinone/menaquinone biosynthesis C-methylase UbiE n=1 Tax=Goodfellowiella coeruleoviolacea TaxID=334858 RepID=A0AAE3KKJ1_9PSEU|nr:methyltransferase domain-containing protein [Goodfellowiella coeruleoviolacea]MCP2170197.1 Ubiquinone/menaquinone biosynthesis C-methylase UbiE [Goodfellowiella coeruleoviolacea]
MDGRSGEGRFTGVFDRLADVYDAADVEFFKPVARHLLDRVAVQPGERVLDIGCGRGAVLFPAAAAVGPAGAVVGVDLAPAMVRAATAEALRRGLANVTVLEMDGQRPGFEPASFDVITGSMSIGLFPDLPTALGNYRALLRPGGRLGISAPVPPASLGAWALGPLRLRHLVDAIDTDALVATSPRLARFFGDFPFGRPGELVDLLGAAGFVDVSEHRVDVPLVAPSPEQLLEWTWSNGLRIFWEQVPEHRRAAVTERLVADLAGHRDAEGNTVAVYLVSFYLAHVR